METTLPKITSPAPSESRLSGRSILPGLGTGRAWVVADVLKSSGPPTPIDQDDVGGELIRLAHSVEETLAELDGHAKRIDSEFDATLAAIFRAHGEMLRGLFASAEFECELKASLLTAEAVVRGDFIGTPNMKSWGIDDICFDWSTRAVARAAVDVRASPNTRLKGAVYIHPTLAEGFWTLMEVVKSS